MKYVVIVHVKGAGALTSPIFGSLDLAEADVTKIRRFQHEAAGDITDLPWLSVRGADIISAACRDPHPIFAEARRVVLGRADVMRLNFRRSVPQYRRSPFPPGE